MNDADRYSEALHNIRTGIRYHYRRQDFYERWHRMTGVISLVLSSTAVMAFFQSAVAASVASALVAIAQALDLMFETRKHADLHRDLRQRYIMLEPEVVASDGLTANKYRKIKEELASIEVDEPPLRSVVLLLAQNEAGIATGFDKDAQGADWYTEVGRVKRFLANVLF